MTHTEELPQELKETLKQFEKKFTAFGNVYADKKEMIEFFTQALATAHAVGRAEMQKEQNKITLQPNDLIEFHGGLYIGNKGDGVIEMNLPQSATISGSADSTGEV